MTQAFRVIRLIRLIRALRIFRILRSNAFRAMLDLRKMIYALESSIRTLVWSILLLLFEMSFFAICFVQGVNNLRADIEGEIPPELENTFGRIGRAYRSL